MKINSLISTISKSSDSYHKDGQHRNGIYTFVNPFSYLILRKTPDLLYAMDGVYVDGISMCLWIRLFWGKKIIRHSFDMTSIAKDLFEKCNKTGESIYFIGSKEEQVSNAIRIINESYPNLNIMGYRNGYFDSEQDKSLTIEKIITLNPKYTIIGMGTPNQEKFIIDLKKAGYTGTAFSCGGFLHQTSSGLQYYPEWVDKYNLRGFYRQYKEKGIFKRNYDTFILFPFVFLFDTIKSRIMK